MISRAASVCAALLLSLPNLAEARPRAAPVADTDVSSCGAPPPAEARWFYFGAPGDHAAAPAARRALQAILDAFDGDLPRDPRCLHVEVLDEGAFEQRYKKIDRRGSGGRAVGFHSAKLGVDSTVYVQPQPGQGLDVVILHEVLHAFSHRFSAEAGRRRLNHLVEGATEYLTRELAEASLGVPRKAFRTGYGDYVRFYDALMKRLGDNALPVLASAYLGDGYDAFEREVDRRLGPRLRECGHALEADDLGAALQRLSARAGSDEEARSRVGTKTPGAR